VEKFIELHCYEHTLIYNITWVCCFTLKEGKRTQSS